MRSPGKPFQAKGTASAKALRQNLAGCELRASPRPVWGTWRARGRDLKVSDGLSKAKTDGCDLRASPRPVWGRGGRGEGS